MTFPAFRLDHFYVTRVRTDLAVFFVPIDPWTFWFHGAHVKTHADDKYPGAESAFWRVGDENVPFGVDRLNTTYYEITDELRKGLSLAGDALPFVANQYDVQEIANMILAARMRGSRNVSDWELGVDGTAPF